MQIILALSRLIFFAVVLSICLYAIAAPNRTPLCPKESVPAQIVVGRWQSAWAVYDIIEKPSGHFRLVAQTGVWHASGWLEGDVMIVRYDCMERNSHWLSELTVNGNRMNGWSCLASGFDGHGKPLKKAPEVWKRIP